MREKVILEKPEYVPLLALEEILRARIGWADASVSPFALAAKNQRNITRFKQKPVRPVFSPAEDIKLAG